MDSKVEQAREWAEWLQSQRDLFGEKSQGARAAALTIQSLPDQWVDADKLRQIIDFQGTSISEEARKDLKSLLTPPLPTLADMIEQGNDPQQYQWMQCTVEGRGGDTFVIVMVREHVTKVLHPDGMHEVKRNSQVTPLPDLPKLEWPGSDPDDVAYATGGALTTQDVVDECRAVRKERALPRPEDVPSGEAWLVRYKERELAAYKADRSCEDEPWIVYLSYKEDYWWLSDADITLISRLVPEHKENA